MLTTCARVSQEVNEPLIGIQRPMLCSRMGDMANRHCFHSHRSAGSHALFTGAMNPRVMKHNIIHKITQLVYQHLEDGATRWLTVKIHRG